MEFSKQITAIPGCFELQPNIRLDPRGSFVKTFHEGCFRDLGLCTQWAEHYYTISKQGVLRGMHFQVPPHDHVKLVYCIQGEVMDVALDLRRGSPTYGHHVCLNLSSTNGKMIYLESGLAHGFFTLSPSSTMVYCVSSTYQPGYDSGVRWDTAGIQWPSENPLVSERDRNLIALESFDSPFRFLDTSAQEG